MYANKEKKMFLYYISIMKKLTITAFLKMFGIKEVRMTLQQ